MILLTYKSDAHPTTPPGTATIRPHPRRADGR
jgi:hypothetical protein